MFRMLWTDLCKLGRSIEHYRQSYVDYLLGESRDMALLTKDQIWQADDSNFEDVPCPEWGGEVRIRGLSGFERDQFEAKSMVKGKGGTKEINHRNLRARLIAACAINEDGSPLFDIGDIIHLGQKSAVPIDRLFDAARKLSGMTPEDVKEMEEDLEQDQSDKPTSV